MVNQFAEKLEQPTHIPESQSIRKQYNYVLQISLAVTTVDDRVFFIFALYRNQVPLDRKKIKYI